MKLIDLLVCIFVSIVVVMVSLVACPPDAETAGHQPDGLTSALDLSGLTGEKKIAHWNIRILSDRSRDDMELNKIADVIQKYQFVAISELRDTRVLDRLQKILRGRGLVYHSIVSDKVGRGRHKELYAFLYDPDFALVGVGGLVDDADDLFARDPFWATFRAGSFDFSIIVSHVIWGRRVGDRRAEIRALASVYEAVQALNGAENDVLLVGDFNRNPSDVRAWKPLLDLPSMIMLFQLPQKSHIKDSSLYDNILFQLQYTTEYTGRSGIDRFDETMFDNHDRVASLAVSDHRPVWASFRTNDIDDD